MATITLRYEGGGHIFQERKINVEHREVLVGRSSEKKKPHTGNAIFSCLGIAREQAVLRYDNYTKRFYLRNIDASTGCTVNGEVAGFYDDEIMNADREYRNFMKKFHKMVTPIKGRHLMGKWSLF